MLVGVALSPVITAVDNDTDNVDDELRDSEIGISDDYEEIFTYLDAIADINWIKRRGILRGEVEIVRREYHFIPLFGFRRSNGGVEGFFEEAVYVHVFTS